MRVTARTLPLLVGAFSIVLGGLATLSLRAYYKNLRQHGSALVTLSSNVGSQRFTPRSWTESSALAKRIIADLNLIEKIGIVKGDGIFSKCTGSTKAAKNFPSLCLQDGPAGLRSAELVSGFPAGINAAATFNRRLIYARGRAMGEEAFRKGVNILLAPSIDIMRSPYAGRAWESFGPDPYLVGSAGAETIRGIQDAKVMACAKHLLGNNQERNRFTENSVIDQRTMHEVYLAPFYKAVAADVSAVMCAYNKLNGTYSCENPALIGLNGILRQELGFPGMVISDWGATHGSARDVIDAGLSMEQPGQWMVIGGESLTGLKFDVFRNQISEAQIDAMVLRIITPWFRLRQDETFSETNIHLTGDEAVDVRSAAHTALIRQIGAASTVLLKNDGAILPLPKRIDSIAVIGSDTLMQRSCKMNQCDNGTVSIGWGSGTNSLDYLVPPIRALRDHVNSNDNMTRLVLSTSDDIVKAQAAAKQADIALVFVHATSGEGGTGLTDVKGVYGDRNDLLLWNNGEALIQAVAGVSSQVIVVVHTVGPIVMEEWIENSSVKGVLLAGLPGEQSGPSLLDILFGEISPSGRLPYTIARHESDYGARLRGGSGLAGAWQALEIPYTEQLLVDYRRFSTLNIPPRFAFGFGLSYTTFHYTNFSVTSHTDTSVSLSVLVTNTGRMSGVEIVQLYLTFPNSSGEPPLQLKAFEAVHLDVSASTTVDLIASGIDVSVWYVEKQAWIRPKGQYEASVGGSSDALILTATWYWE